jgi:hypothetical protein
MGQGCVTALLGVFFAPFVLGGLYAFFYALSDKNVGAALIVVALLVPPILVFVGLSWLGRRQLQGPVVRLRTACAATPPRRPGEPATCHVCGAPVETLAGQAVSRCAYCSADNLIDAPALRAGAARRAIEVADVAAAVTREARSLGGVAIGSYATVIATLVAIPVVTFASLVASFFVSMEVELPAESQPYAVVEIGKKKCIGEVSNGNVSFGSKPPAGFPTSTPVGHSEQVPATRLAGRTLEDGRRIVRVISHPPGQNWMVLDSKDESVVLGACLR